MVDDHFKCEWVNVWHWLSGVVADKGP